MTIATDNPAGLHATFDGLRTTWRDTRPSVEQRRADLSRLRDRLRDRMEEMCEAIEEDFGHRARHETLLGEGGVVLSEIDHTLAKLKHWVRPERRKAARCRRYHFAVELPGQPGACPLGGGDRGR